MDDKKIAKTTIILFIFEVLIIVFLLPTHYFTNALYGEKALYHSSLGSKEAAIVLERGHDWYDSTITYSDLYDYAYNLFNFKVDPDLADDGNLDNMNKGMFEYVAERFEALENFIELFFNRVSLIVSWIPYMLIFSVSIIFTGISTYLIKKTNFDFASSFRSAYALKFSYYFVLIIIASLIAPITIHPIFFPLGGGLLLFFISQTIANMQKRI